jgi:hypothetical protein
MAHRSWVVVFSAEAFSGFALGGDVVVKKVCGDEILSSAKKCVHVSVWAIPVPVVNLVFSLSHEIKFQHSIPMQFF